MVAPLGGTIVCEPHPAGGVRPSSDPGYLRAVLDAATRTAADLPRTELVPAPALASAALDPLELVALVRRLEHAVADGADGVVVTTGTDTLEEVAFVLDLLWGRPEPLVLTGAMRHRALPGHDGPGNVGDALRVAAHPAARGQGALVTLAGHIHHAWQVSKIQTGALSAFASTVSGPVGSVQEDTARFTTFSVIDRPHIVPGRLTPAPVALVTAGLGDDGRLLDALPSLGYRAVVVQAMGGGSVPPAWIPRLERLAAVIPLVYTRRTGGGATLRVTYGGPGSERDLRRIGGRPAGLLDGWKARLLLTLLLAVDAGLDEIVEALDRFDRPRSTGLRATVRGRAAAAEPGASTGPGPHGTPHHRDPPRPGAPSAACGEPATGR